MRVLLLSTDLEDASHAVGRGWVSSRTTATRRGWESTREKKKFMEDPKLRLFTGNDTRSGEGAAFRFSLGVRLVALFSAVVFSEPGWFKVCDECWTQTLASVRAACRRWQIQLSRH
jgi:hypothetical protein